MITILIMLWIACGVFVYGLQFAYNQREFTLIADQKYNSDRHFALCLGLLGPFGLLSFIVVTWCEYGRHLFKHGVKWS